MDEEYKGVCPLCYKPVSNQDDSRSLKNDDREETYHYRCLQDYANQHTPVDADTPGVMMTLLKTHDIKL